MSVNDECKCFYASGDVNAIISLAPALRFNGGGHINHSIFWQNLGPKTEEEPTGESYYHQSYKLPVA